MKLSVHGQRDVYKRQGIMGALFSFIDKSFSALGTGFVGIALSMTGYAKVFPQVGDALTPQLKYMTVFRCV